MADVDVFGGHQPEVKVRVDRDRLAANGLSIGDVVGRTGQAERLRPGRHDLLEPPRVPGQDRQASSPTSSRSANCRSGTSDQGWLRVADVADVSLGETEQRSVYHGNGKPAIAVNVLRPDNGPTVSAIQSRQGVPAQA